MFFTGKRTLLAKEESVYGSDPTPVVGSNGIDAGRIEISHEAELGERNIMRGSLSPLDPVVGKKSVKLSFEVEIKGSGSAGTAPRLGDLIEACGFTETVSAGSSVVYLPSSTTMKSVTFYLYDLADSGSMVLHKVNGARGTFQINAKAGEIAKMLFTFYGIYNIPTDVADPGVPTAEGTKPPVVESAAFTLNGVTSLVVDEVSLDMQNSVITADDISSVNGIKSFNITARKPSGKFSPEAVAMATYDFWTDWVAGTARALSLIIGGTAGNKLTLSLPKVTIDSIAAGDKQGILTRELPFRASQNTGNDEVRLSFS